MISSVVTVEIPAQSARSGTIAMAPYVTGLVRMPTVWTDADLSFLVNEEDSEQTVFQTVITGEATAFSQPLAATALEVVQAADIAADRGRGIVIEGSDDDGAAITETICLHATNTTTAVAGSVSFTTVSGVYTADGAVLGASDVTVRAKGGGTTVCTLAAGHSELAADVPAQATTPAGGADQVVLAGPDADGTFVTLVGTLAGAVVRERVTFDGESPSAAWTNTRFDTLSRICLGEFTNAATGSVKSRDPWVPLYDMSGALIRLVVAANRVLPLPAEVCAARYLRLWSNNAGSDVVQTAARGLVVTLKDMGNAPPYVAPAAA